MRFLITGTAGFIGFHLAERLLREGHVVTGFDGLTPYYDVALKQARIARLARHGDYSDVVGMLEDLPALSAAAELAQPDVIVHLAAQAGVRYSLDAPRTYVDSNVVGSWNVLEVANRLRPQHLMLASTSSVYGANPDVPFRETDRADEQLSLYAATKKGMEAMAHSQAHLHRVPTTAFRFFTVYGPWGRPDMALFKFVRAILDDQPIDVYGQGRLLRDFTFIDDLVEAVTRLVPLAPDESNRVADVDTLSAQGPFRTINIGGGEPVGLMDFIATVERCLGRSARLNMLPMQPGDVPRTVAAPQLLHALTGYTPATRIDAGVAAFVQWYRAYFGA